MFAALIAAASLVASGSASAAADQCPVLPASAVTAAKAKLTTLYQNEDGFAFHRERGPSRCSRAGETRTCVIDDPGVMEARLNADVTYFDVPAGRQAVLTVRNGKLHCNLAN